MATAGADVVGVDWRVPLDEARRRVGPDRAVQGNLDPALCLAPFDVVAAGAREVLARAGAAPGHIFNLGHGVLPETDPGVLSALVALVHAEGRAGVHGSPGAGASRPVGVLVMAHGTPDRPEGIEAFYTRIRRGRPPTRRQLDELVGRYQRHRRGLPAGPAHRRPGGRPGRPRGDGPGRFVVGFGAKHTDRPSRRPPGGWPAPG